jgi:hypothetical protein
MHHLLLLRFVGKDTWRERESNGQGEEDGDNQ